MRAGGRACVRAGARRRTAALAPNSSVESDSCLSSSAGETQQTSVVRAAAPRPEPPSEGESKRVCPDTGESDGVRGTEVRRLAAVRSRGWRLVAAYELRLAEGEALAPGAPLGGEELDAAAESGEGLVDGARLRDRGRSR